jgi:hypothetical protein
MNPLEAYLSMRKPKASVIEPQSAAMPSMPVRVVHGVQALQRVVVAAVRGQAVLVSAEETERRLAVCQSGCEWWRSEAYGGGGACGHAACGCTKAKMRLSTERCPVGNWEPLIEATQMGQKAGPSGDDLQVIVSDALVEGGEPLTLKNLTE